MTAKYLPEEKIKKSEPVYSRTRSKSRVNISREFLKRNYTSFLTKNEKNEVRGDLKISQAKLQKRNIVALSFII